MIARKRSCSASRTRSSVSSSSRAQSWRSSKSSADSRCFAAAYSAAKSSSSSCSRSRSRAASSSSAARCSRSRASRNASARSPRASRPERSTSCSGFAPSFERDARRGALLLGRGRVVGERLRLGLQLGEPFGHAVLLAELERQRPPGRAELLVDARQHAAEAVPGVGREQPEALGLAPGAERRQRALERLAAEHRRLVVGELVEARVEPDGERMGVQQPRAEAVDRRDPRPVELPGEVVPARARAARRGCASAARPPPCACR